MNILFTICGRAGSKGTPNKNIRLFLGKPLVYYALAVMRLYTREYGADDSIRACLSTDSEELIVQASKREPSMFIIRRSEDLAGDTVAKIAVIKDCLLKSERHYGADFDMVVDLDLTSPLRTAKDIKSAVDKKREFNQTDIVFSVTRARRNPWFNMVKRNSDGTVSKVLKSNFTARQQAPEVFDMNAAVYAYSADFLRANTSNMLFDGVCDIVLMADTAVLDIDDEEDFELMELLCTFFREKNPGLRALVDEAALK